MAGLSVSIIILFLNYNGDLTYTGGVTLPTPNNPSSVLNFFNSNGRVLPESLCVHKVPPSFPLLVIQVECLNPWMCALGSGPSPRLKPASDWSVISSDLHSQISQLPTRNVTVNHDYVQQRHLIEYVCMYVCIYVYVPLD